MPEVHLVEMSLLAEHRYSATLGYLHAAVAADPRLSELAVRKHILDCRPSELQNSISAALATMVEPKLAAFTIYFWNRRHSLELARQIKERWPDCVIVFGGNDVTNQQDKVFAEAPFVDVLVHGEGELRFADLCRAVLCGDGNIDEITGISFRVGEEVMTTPAAERISDIEQIPSPLLTDVYSDADLAATRMIIYETNRGCPYSCSFCFWGGATKSKVRQFSFERIAAELERIVSTAQSGTNIFVADANFGILPRDLDIAELFVSLCLRYNKRIKFMTNWAKNSNSKVVEIATVLHEHDLCGPITLAAQSFDPTTLQIANRSNIKVDRYSRLQDEFRRRHIPTYTDLIWGLPGETYQTYLSGVEQVLSTGGCPVVFPLLLLNNTEYASDDFGQKYTLEVRKLPCEVSDPDLVADVVVGHPDMTPAEWVRGMQHVTATGLFAKSTMRCTLRYLSHVGGVRIVDLVDALMDFVDEGTEFAPDLTLVQQNHALSLLEPERLDEPLLDKMLGDSIMREERHFQALMHVAMDDAGRHRELLSRASQYLVQRFDLARTPGIELLPGVLSLDAVAGSVWRSAIAHTRLTGTWACSPRVLNVLVASGDIPEWEYDPEATVVHGRSMANSERAVTALNYYSLALFRGARRLLWDTETTLLSGARVAMPLAG